MTTTMFPVIDPVATGRNIRTLRIKRGLTIRELQDYFGFEDPRAIYKWQRGETLPSVDNLYALGKILDVPIETILVQQSAKLHIVKQERQEKTCCSVHFAGCPGWHRRRIRFDLFRLLHLSGLKTSAAALFSRRQDPHPFLSIAAARTIKNLSSIPLGNVFWKRRFGDLTDLRHDKIAYDNVQSIAHYINHSHI